jgi:DNA-binding XRE family transcriptional regulator
MTPAETLRAWQRRLGYSQIEAAAALHVPAQTYRNWIRERREVPAPILELARYREKFGPLDAA